MVQQGEFNLTVKLGDDAMVCPDDLAVALTVIGVRVRDGEIGDFIRDQNGNTVGRWDVSLIDVCPVCGDPDHD